MYTIGSTAGVGILFELVVGFVTKLGAEALAIGLSSTADAGERGIEDAPAVGVAKDEDMGVLVRAEGGFEEALRAPLGWL